MVDKTGNKKTNTSKMGLFDLISSVPFALTVLISVGVLGIIGAIVPQRPGNLPTEMAPMFMEQQKAFLGEVFSEVSAFLGFDRLFSSWYFLGLLTALSLSLIVCTLRRIKSLLRKPEPTPPDSGDILELPVGTDAFKLLQRIGYRPRGNPNSVVAEKGRWSRWGSVMIHTSMLLFFLSGLLSWKLEESESVNLTQGPEVYISEKLLPGVSAKVSEITAERDPNTGGIIEYRTALTLFATGEELASQTIRVNHPLSFEGITVYQSDMEEGALGLGLVASPTNSLSVTPEKPNMVILNGSTFLVGGRPVNMEVMNPRDPAGRMLIVTSGNNVFPLAIGEKILLQTSRGDYDLWYTGPHHTTITGLTIKKPAGLSFFWIACSLITLGLLTVFLPLYHRVRLSKTADKQWIFNLIGRVDENALETKKQHLMKRIMEESKK